MPNSFPRECHKEDLKCSVRDKFKVGRVPFKSRHLDVPHFNVRKLTSNQEGKTYLVGNSLKAILLAGR